MVTKYPSLDQYNEAVQYPKVAFADAILKAGSVAVNGFDIPIALGGGFAITYTVTAQGKKFAVRCFHKAAPGIESRYERISSVLRSGAQTHFVGFEFQADGLLVNGKRYPLVKMDWAAGETLGTYIESQYKNASAVQRLRDGFRSLETHLRDRGIAHGDLQNGNVIVASGLKLIDYDGMFVPGLAAGSGSEIGHRHFQHAKRSASHFGPSMDRFSFIVLDLSLRALIERPALFETYSNGENILFSGSDFADPGSSPALAAVRSISTLMRDCDHFARICTASIDQVPSLDDFLAGRNIPPAAIIVRAPTPAGRAAKPAIPQYVGAFDVLDAKDFDAVHEHIGERIELIGRITDVSEKRTRRGGRPYIFVNFGPWKGKIVKINIWSEGLARLQKRPDQSWVGKYVSVTGLVDTPYSSRKYGYTHLSITITESNQLRVIDEAEAARRLRATTPQPDTAGASSNTAILDAIRGGTKPSRATKRPSASTSRSTNQAILDQIRAGAPSPQSTPGPPSPLPYQPPQKRSGPSWNWLWWFLGAIAILRFITTCSG